MYQQGWHERAAGAQFQTALRFVLLSPSLCPKFIDKHGFKDIFS